MEQTGLGLSNVACYVIALSYSAATLLIFFITKDYILFINILKSAHLLGH
jgi:polyferredoxin